MSAYFNRNDCLTYILFSGIAGQCEYLLQDGCRFHNGRLCRNAIALVGAWAKKVLDIMDKDVDEDCIKGVWKRSKGVKLECIPEMDPRFDHSLGYFITPEDLEILLSQAVGHCEFCDFPADEARRCPLRGALLRSGCTPNTDLAKSKDCPYRRDV